MNSISIGRVTGSAELVGIKALQTNNLRKYLTDHEAGSQGFVTAEYSMEFLEQLHLASPSIIAKDGDLVIGYALVAPNSVRQLHPLLGDLFDTIDTITYSGQLLKEVNYIVVGQLCVDKEYRRMGIASRMYNYYKDCLSDQYDYCITDVAQANPGSLKTHIKKGFQVIDTLTYGGVSWDIVLWNWKS